MEICGRAFVWSGTWTAETKLDNSLAVLIMAAPLSFGERDNSAVNTKVSCSSASLNRCTKKSDREEQFEDDKLGIETRKA